MLPRHKLTKCQFVDQGDSYASGDTADCHRLQSLQFEPQLLSLTTKLPLVCIHSKVTMVDSVCQMTKCKFRQK